MSQRHSGNGTIPNGTGYPMAEQQALLNGDSGYSPSPEQDTIPMTIFSNDKGKTHHEIGTQKEKESMLVTGVSLSPGWENEQKPDEELFVKKDEIDQKAPHDRFMLVYAIFVIHGIGTLMPWNMFITAESYFTDYKLATNSSSGTEYTKNFISYLGIAAQLPNVVLNLINLLFHCGGGTTGHRIIGSIIVVVSMFILTVVLAMVDSTEWPEMFFMVTMISVVIINAANGVYQNCIYGLASSLPMKYTNAVVLGSNASGTLASLIAILSIAIAPDTRTSAIYYFVTAIVVLLIAFDTYFVLPALKFYKFYARRREEPAKMPINQSLTVYAKVIKQVWVQLACVWFIFFVSLSCFPALQVEIERTDPTSFLLADKYFTPVTCFLVFNSFAMCGNLTTEFMRKPGPKWVFIPVLLRFLFIPFFALCNYRPETRTLPVLIDNDYVYVLAAIAMAFSSGYFSSLCMMYTPMCVEPQYKGIAAMMAAFCLVLGIFCGINFALFVSFLTENI